MLINVRYLEPSDTQALFCMENDPQNWQYTHHSDAPYSIEEIENFVRLAPCDLTVDGQLRYIIDLAGQVIGTIDLYEFDAVARLAWVAVLIYPSAFRGRGYAHDAVHQLIDICRTMGCIDRLLAESMENNVASRALFFGCGFVLSDVDNVLELKL